MPNRPPPPPPDPAAGAVLELLILGRGRLGRSLAGALEAAGRPATLLPARDWQLHEQALSAGDSEKLVMLAVPEAALPVLVEELAEAALPAADAYVHVSGSLGLDALRPLAEAGHRTGSFHPLQSFPRVRPPAAFTGGLVAVDADDEDLLADLLEMAAALGATGRRVRDGERAHYHAAAVMASNYLVALSAQAAGVLEAAGWDRDEAVAALLPLMAGVLESLADTGLPGALTGPIRRGDAETVRNHIEALRSFDAGPDVSPLQERVYRMLGLAALEVAVEAGLEPSAADLVKEALTA